MKKLLVIGHGRHGKDTVCEILQQYHGFKFISSSLFASGRAVFPNWPVDRVPYASAEDCFDDRHHHRQVWFELISEYNRLDPSRLAREMVEAGYDGYCGMRCAIELAAARKTFDEVWWVDASQRLPLEDSSSITIEYDPSYMKLIRNNHTLRDLWFEVDTAVYSDAPNVQSEYLKHFPKED